MFNTTAPASAAMSPTSCRACAMTGDAPSASSALAVTSMTTRFVTLWTSGARCRIASTSFHTPALLTIFTSLFRPPDSGVRLRLYSPTCHSGEEHLYRIPGGLTIAARN